MIKTSNSNRNSKTNRNSNNNEERIVKVIVIEVVKNEYEE